MKRLLLGALLCGQAAGAGLAPELFGAESFSQQFRSFLINKITQMDQNFIREVQGREVYYYSNKWVRCQDSTKAAPRQKLFRINYAQSLEEDKYAEHRFYYGCDGGLAWRETIRAEGVEQNLHTAAEILTGEMNLKAAGEYERFSYELADSESNPVFSIHGHLLEGGGSMSFSLSGDLFMRRTISESETGKVVRYYSSPFQFNLDRNGYRFNMSSSGAFEGFLEARLGEANTQYFNNKRERISLAEFQQKFIFHGGKFIMDSLLAALPKTEFVATNMAGGKMLDELRNAQTFLISGTQLNLVRNLIEEYIKAVQKGAIVDRRQ